eukprot:TRINITY_DN74534_c0_g1_i1.p1 TRINITY_DN74534_c0_g1~~TRINITY_DN74534_c0_g1_i1.p1  ORF type:complete len:591 (+),score=157.06 TRINITY_DN74534_c0_g1_i1:99-1775(+)
MSGGLESRVFNVYVIGAFQDTIVVARRLSQLLYEAFLVAMTTLCSALQLDRLKGAQAKVLAFAGAVVVLAVAFLCVMEDSQFDTACPAATPKRAVPADGAVALLALAEDSRESEAGKLDILRECVAWSPAGGKSPALEQVRAQLQCHITLAQASSQSTATKESGEHGLESAEDAASSLETRMRTAMGAVRGIGQRCDDLNAKLHSLVRTKTAARKPSEAIVALGGLAGFEGIVGETFATFKVLDDAQSFIQSAGSADELAELQSTFTGCLLKVVREARVVAQALPAASPAVARIQRCKPDMLSGFEGDVLQQAARLSAPEVALSAGLLLSEQATAGGSVPLFAQRQSQLPLEPLLDTHGFQVPASMASSEQLLYKSLEATDEASRKDLSKQVLMRLVKHAKVLAETKEYDAAEWRYQAGAALGKQHGHDQLASSVLAQLSYFLMLHGRYDEALEAATEALIYNNDALAVYLNITLRIQLGEMRTNEQATEALQKLKEIHGKLPAEHLEQARASLTTKLESWQEVSESSFLSCFGFGDAAFLLSCLLGKFAYSGNDEQQ